MEHALVVLSGGQDSTTCLYYAKAATKKVSAITFIYGQRHHTEVHAAETIAEMAMVQHEVIVLGHGTLKSTSPLTDRTAEVETYASVDVLPGGIEKTFVPMRNALFLTVAANRAIALGCDTIIIGVSEEDYGGYPDCRDAFISAMQSMICFAVDGFAPCPRLHAPLLYLNKADTVRLAQTLPGCMEALAWSHTCYNGRFPPCEHCHACLLRARGFEQAGVPDPLTNREA